jgi:hypothetical protein
MQRATRNMQHATHTMSDTRHSDSAQRGSAMKQSTHCATGNAKRQRALQEALP